MAKNCEKCGNVLQDAAVFCPVCGMNTNGNGSVNQGQPTGNVYNGTQYYPTMKSSLKDYNLASILGLMLACMSMLLNANGIPAIGSILLSFMGLHQVCSCNERGKGFAIAGLIVGGISLLYQTIVILNEIYYLF